MSNLAVVEKKNTLLVKEAIDFFTLLKEKESEFIKTHEKQYRKLAGSNLPIKDKMLMKLAYSEAAQLFYKIGFTCGVASQKRKVQAAMGLLDEGPR